MRMIHLAEPDWSATFSHLRMAQNTSAVNRLDKAYTSPSTALNQNESLNVYAKAPMAPAPSTATAAPPSG